MGEQLALYDALDPGAKETYDPRLLRRLGAAKPTSRFADVTRAGMILRVTLETRDDVVLAERFTTRVVIDVKALVAGTVCRVPRIHLGTVGESPTLPRTPNASFDWGCTGSFNEWVKGDSIGIFTSMLSDLGKGPLKLTPELLPPASRVVVQFKPGQSALDSAAQAALGDAADILVPDPNLAVCIVSHENGPNGLDLVMKRVALVKKYLAGRGIDAPRMKLVTSSTQAGLAGIVAADNKLSLYVGELAQGLDEICDRRRSS